MPNHQYNLDLITHQFEASVIEQRSGDGYINATQLCTVAKKAWHNYKMLETTGHFLRALSAKTKISQAALTEQTFATNGSIVDVWVHPQVALHLAQWLSAEFAVQVTEWIQEWMSGKRSGGRGGQLPYHLERHMTNLGRVPPTHFSILQEMTMTLIAPLEAHGYTLPQQMVPDISQGKMFCKFARETLGIDTDALPTYKHSFPDGRVVDAKLYPVECLGQFRKFINEVWMPQRAEEYFRTRDPQALPLLDKVLLLGASRPSLPAPAKRPRRA